MATHPSLGRASIRRSIACAAAAVCLAAGGGAAAQGEQGQDARVPPSAAAVPAPPAPAGVAAVVPADYLIGADDLLTIVFWRERDLSGEFVVRPDGKISLPLLNDVQAAGLTPEQLRVVLTKAAERLFQDPAVAVIVKQVNSRQVFITGEVGKPGAYPLTRPTTVIQLIAIAGGVNEYADKTHIVVMRFDETGHQWLLPFDYEAVSKRRNMRQNIELKPGDTIIVP